MSSDSNDSFESSFRFLSLFYHIWCGIEVHNVTSRSDIMCDFGRPMTGTNLREIGCILKAKKCFLDVFSTFRLQVVFYRYLHLHLHLIKSVNA